MKCTHLLLSPAIKLIQDYPNIVVSPGRLDLRESGVIQLMNNFKAPYNVNKLTSEVAVNAMKQFFRDEYSNVVRAEGGCGEGIGEVRFCCQSVPLR